MPKQFVYILQEVYPVHMIESVHSSLELAQAARPGVWEQEPTFWRTVVAGRVYIIQFRTLDTKSEDTRLTLPRT